MFVVTNRVPVANEWGEEFEARFRQRVGQMDSQPGLLRMEVMRPLDESSPYLVMTVWRDKKAFDDWVVSEDFKLAHQNPLPKEAISGKGGMEQHEIIIQVKNSSANGDS